MSGGGNTGRGSGHLSPALIQRVSAVKTGSLQALTMPFHKKIPKVLSEADISALLDDEGVTEIGDSDSSDDTNDPDYSGESGTEEDDCEVDDVAHSQQPHPAVHRYSHNLQNGKPQNAQILYRMGTSMVVQDHLTHQAHVKVNTTHCT